MADPHYSRASDVLFSDLGDDFVALKVSKGRCYGFEDVTAEVWSLMATPVTIEQLCDQLVERFEVDRETCRADVTALVAELRAEGLVTVSPSD